MRTTLAVGVLGVFLSLLACKKGSADKVDPAATGSSATAPVATATAAPDPQPVIARLADGDKAAEGELVAMGRDAVVPLGSWMITQDDKVASAPKDKKYMLNRPILRAIVVCQRIGADAEPALMLLHKHTKDSGIRTYTCIALKKVGSTCPAGER